MRVRLLAVAALCAGLLAAPTAAGAAEPPSLEARAWALVDARTGELLAARAANQRLPIASTTKMMTAYVARRELPLRKRVHAQPYTPLFAESLLRLRAGQRVSVRDLLYGLIMRSGNDAARDLAVAAAGSEAAFVLEMNRYAAALGLADTRFANAIGLDAAGNYSSAYDLTALGRRFLRDPVLARIAGARRAVLRSLRPPRRIATRNDLLYRVPWATGIKTGYTAAAGYVLVGSARLDGVELVSAVLGTASERARDVETERLLSYGFSLQRRAQPIRAGAVLATPAIRYSGGELPLRAGRGVVVGVREGQRLRVVARAPREVEGPLGRGVVLGRATVLLDGRRVASVPLRAARAVPAPTRFEKARSAVRENLGWIALALFGILLVAGSMRRRRRRARRRRAR